MTREGSSEEIVLRPTDPGDDSASIENLIVITAESERRYVEISDVPDISDIEGGKILEVGNTGLKLKFLERNNQYEISGDFMPGGQMEPGGLGPQEAAKIFCYAIWGLKKTVDSNNWFDLKKIKSLKSVTNKTFGDFLVKIFDRFDHGDLITLSEGERDGVIVEVELGSVFKLKSDDKLVQFIDRLAKRAEGNKYNLLVPVEV